MASFDALLENKWGNFDVKFNVTIFFLSTPLFDVAIFDVTIFDVPVINVTVFLHLNEIQFSNNSWKKNGILFRSCQK